MIEHREIQRRSHVGAELDPFDASNHVFDCRWVEARFRERAAEWICIISDYVPTQESGLHNSRSASHERIVDDIARLCQAIDEEPRQLRLETGSVRDLVQRGGLPLTRSPEFTGETNDALTVKMKGFYLEIGTRDSAIEQTVDETMIRSFVRMLVCAGWDRHGSGISSGIGKLLDLLPVRRQRTFATGSE